MKRNRKRSFGMALLLLAATVLFAFPFYWLLISAFKSKADIFALPPGLLPIPPVLDNFAQAFAETNILRAFANSLVIAVAHVSLALFLCSLGGYAFAKFPHARGNRFLFALVIGTMMVPQAITMIPSFVVLANLRLVNTYWAMVLPGAASAFGIFWMRQYIASHVPDELIDAARIDGCGEFRIYWNIVLPVCRPPLAALGVLTLIANWNNLMWAFVVLRTEEMYTLPLQIYLLQGEVHTPYGMLMACGLLATLPLVVAFLFFQKAFIEGLTAGAVKG